MISRTFIIILSTTLMLACAGDMDISLDQGADMGWSSQGMAGGAGVPLRYLAINVGNASLQYGCWEYKLCRPEDVNNVRNYIAAWQPDVIVLSEVYREAQLTGTANGGPILPAGYTGVCGRSVNRHTGAAAAHDAADASHEHECVAWKTGRLSLIPGSERSAYGRNDSWGKSNCGYDFTGFRVELMLDGAHPITAVSVHPDSKNVDCRTEEIARYWRDLAKGSSVIIAGDFNTGSATELQRRASYANNFAGGRHWNVANHDEYTAFYLFGIKYKYDWAFSNAGAGCTSCGSFYGTADLRYGSAVGGYDGMPRADGGEGMDHRQILVDMMVAGAGGACAHEPFVTGAALADGCSACAASVCATDPYCCATAWDSACVRQANERCTPCSHATNVTGDPLFNGCNDCVARVCAADPWCCNTSWDSVCVSQAASMCP
jgi:endonuclease/exonuclease/phosphatase family metal-dependent hydrolase